jgi:hypothetical protein
MLLCAFIACKPPRQLATPLECGDRHSSLAMQQARAMLEALEHCQRHPLQAHVENPDEAACLPDWLTGLWLQWMECQVECQLE